MGLDLFASDIETCKHVSASLGFVVIPASERESPYTSRNAEIDAYGVRYCGSEIRK